MLGSQWACRTGCKRYAVELAESSQPPSIILTEYQNGGRLHRLHGPFAQPTSGLTLDRQVLIIRKYIRYLLMVRYLSACLSTLLALLALSPACSVRSPQLNEAASATRSMRHGRCTIRLSTDGTDTGRETRAPGGGQAATGGGGGGADKVRGSPLLALLPPLMIKGKVHAPVVIAGAA